MKNIWKFSFSLKAAKFTLDLPPEFKFLSVAFQNDEPNMYVEVGEFSAREEIQFQFFGTGHDIPVAATWLTTFNFGPFVFHLYRL